MESERGITFWEVCLSLAILLGWTGLIVPFIESGSERVEQLEKTVRVYERLQGEVLKDEANPSGQGEVCIETFCLPTL